MTELRKIKGWSKVPHTYEARLASSKLSSRKLRILIFIWSKTIGFGKAEANIYYSQYEKPCNIKKRHAYNLIQELIKEGWLIINGGKIHIKLTYEEWVSVTENGNDEALPFLDKSVTDLGVKSVTDSGNLLRTPKETTKEKVFQNPLTEEERKKFLKGIHKLKEDLKKGPDRKIKEGSD